jgi:hypothetical protein
LDAARVNLTARRGTLVGPRRAGTGLLEWRYRAPPPSSEEAKASTFTPDHLEARWRRGGPLAKEAFDIDFDQGPAARLHATSASPLVFRGGSIPVRLEVSDPLGLPRPAAVLETQTDEGTFSPWKETAPGRWESRFSPAPNGEASKARLTFAAFGPTGGEPAALRTWLLPDGLHLAVVDGAGRPVSNQPLTLDRKPLQTDARGLAVVHIEPGAHVLAHAKWPALRKRLWLLDGGHLLFPRDPPLEPVKTSLALEVAPAVPVNVRVQVEGRELRYWAEDTDGNVLADRPLSLWLSEGAGQEASQGGGVHRLRVPGTGAVSVVVADVQTGVSVVAKVAP